MVHLFHPAFCDLKGQEQTTASNELDEIVFVENRIQVDPIGDRISVHQEVESWRLFAIHAAMCQKRLCNISVHCVLGACGDIMLRTIDA